MLFLILARAITLVFVLQHSVENPYIRQRKLDFNNLELVKAPKSDKTRQDVYTRIALAGEGSRSHSCVKLT